MHMSHTLSAGSLNTRSRPDLLAKSKDAKGYENEQEREKPKGNPIQDREGRLKRNHHPLSSQTRLRQTVIHHELTAIRPRAG
jgi:hypothetical protein